MTAVIKEQLSQDTTGKSIVFFSFMHWSISRCSTIVERKHPKYTSVYFITPYLFPSVQLQFMYLKAVFTKWVLTYWAWYLHSSTYIHQTIQFYYYLCSEGFYWGICLYIIHQIYITFYCWHIFIVICWQFFSDLIKSDKLDRGGKSSL